MFTLGQAAKGWSSSTPYEWAHLFHTTHYSDTRVGRGRVWYGGRRGREWSCGGGQGPMWYFVVDLETASSSVGVNWGGDVTDSCHFWEFFSPSGVASPSVQMWGFLALERERCEGRESESSIFPFVEERERDFMGGRKRTKNRLHNEAFCLKRWLRPGRDTPLLLHLSVFLANSPSLSSFYPSLSHCSLQYLPNTYT